MVTVGSLAQRRLTELSERRSAAELAAAEATKLAEMHARSPATDLFDDAHLPAAWWCEQGDLCILDWTPCNRIEVRKGMCPPMYKFENTPARLMGNVIRGAFDLLARDCPAATLVMPYGQFWYKNQPYSSIASSALTRLSRPMLGVAARIANMHMRCPSSVTWL